MKKIWLIVFFFKLQFCFAQGFQEYFEPISHFGNKGLIRYLRPDNGLNPPYYIFKNNYEVNNVTFTNHNYELFNKLIMADFEEDVVFNACEFVNNTKFGSINTKKNITFKDCQFLSDIQFGLNYFECDFKIIEEKDKPISGIINFFANQIEKNLILENLKFNKAVYIESTHVKKKFSFKKSEISKLNLRGIYNRANVWDWSYTIFKSSPTLSYVTLPDTLDLRYLRLENSTASQANEKIDFRYCILSNLMNPPKLPKCKIWIEGTDVSKFLLPYNLFDVQFPSWASYEMITGTYESIIKNCKDNGMYDSEQSWNIELQVFKNEHDNPSFGRYLNMFHKYWWNFGYEKWLILIKWLPLLFIIFFVLNIVFIEYLYKNVYRDNELGAIFKNENLRKYFIKETPNFKKIFFRISYSFFYTATIYFGFKLKHDSLNYNNLGMLYIYLVYGIGAIHIAFGLSYILGVY